MQNSGNQPPSKSTNRFIGSQNPSVYNEDGGSETSSGYENEMVLQPYTLMGTCTEADLWLKDSASLVPQIQNNSAFGGAQELNNEIKSKSGKVKQGIIKKLRGFLSILWNEVKILFEKNNPEGLKLKQQSIKNKENKLKVKTNKEMTKVNNEADEKIEKICAEASKKLASLKAKYEAIDQQLKAQTKSVSSDKTPQTAPLIGPLTKFDSRKAEEMKQLFEDKQKIENTPMGKKLELQKLARQKETNQLSEDRKKLGDTPMFKQLDLQNQLVVGGVQNDIKQPKGKKSLEEGDVPKSFSKEVTQKRKESAKDHPGGSKTI